MPLYISEKDGVMEVREEQLFFDGTTVSWHYLDLKNRLESSHGRQGDKPDRPMSQDAVDWAVKHYVPNIAPYQPTHEEWVASPEGKAFRQNHDDKEAARSRQLLAELFQRQAENARLTFPQKCALMLEETGYSVRDAEAPPVEIPKY